jgi:hypothetical protein
MGLNLHLSIRGHESQDAINTIKRGAGHEANEVGWGHDKEVDGIEK